MSPIRTAVIGVGGFGRHHVRVFREMPDVELTAVVDIEPERAKAATAEHGCQALQDYRELFGKVDAAVVAVPTTLHEEIGCALLDAGIDILVEKPIAATMSGAERLIETAERTRRIFQVGHLERFNPAVEAVRAKLTTPLFFEIHRLSMFSPRSLDVDVVLDLMIHDIDLVLDFTGRMPEEIQAAGISILSDKVDIANVRLAFAGGCVANLTASRVSTEKVRKMRLFQPHQYISLDYDKQQAVAFTVAADRQIGFQPMSAPKQEPLQRELASFCESVRTREAPRVTGRAAAQALGVCLQILDKIEEHSQVVSSFLAGQSKP